MTFLIFHSFVVVLSQIAKKKWEIVRTYVEHVKNICHELANPLIKHILLVIG